jgi:hypothetical protein
MEKSTIAPSSLLCGFSSTVRCANAPPPFHSPLCKQLDFWFDEAGLPELYFSTCNAETVSNHVLNYIVSLSLSLLLAFSPFYSPFFSCPPSVLLATPIAISLSSNREKKREEKG